VKPIGIGEEVTAHYGDDYCVYCYFSFSLSELSAVGRRNRHCLCQSCERNNRGGYAPDDQEPESSSSDSDDSDRSSSSSETEKDVEPLNVNERRTRRGIYAVMPEIESTAPKIELEDTALPSSPPIPAIGLATPESISRAPSTSSTLTSLSATENDAMLSTAPKRVVAIRPSTRLKISSTPPERQLLTPPLSAEPSASVRTSARLQARGGDKPDASGSRRPTPTTSKARKTETAEPESRVLRPRPQVESASAPPKSPPKPSKGKKSAAEKEKDKLPTCSTCKGILPIICVDDEVIWGLLPEGEGGKRKGKNKVMEEKRECPRCLRHYAIYNVPWPSRVPANGGPAFEPVPRKERDRMHEMLSSSRRGSSVTSSLKFTEKGKSKTRRRDEDNDEEEDERPSKKRKLNDLGKGRASLSKKLKSVLGVAKRPVGRPRKSVTVSPKSKRKREPESSEEGSEGGSEAESTNSSPQNSHRKTKKPAIRLVAETERRPSPLPKLKARPLVTRVYKPSRDQRASARASFRAKMEIQAKAHAQESPSDESDVMMVEPDLESLHLSGDENVDAEPDSIHSSGAPRLRYNGASYLFHAPNPLSFARRKWVPVPVELDQENESEHGPPISTSTNHSTSDEEETLGPVTPDDADQPRSVTLEDEDLLGDGLPALLVPRASVFGRAMKPSPVNFAIRRWSGLSVGVDKEKDKGSEDDTAIEEDPARTPPLTRKYVSSRIWEAGSPGRKVRVL
jgi:histone-lysine N-methyltransferase SUV420H